MTSASLEVLDIKNKIHVRCFGGTPVAGVIQIMTMTLLMIIMMIVAAVHTSLCDTLACAFTAGALM